MIDKLYFEQHFLAQHKKLGSARVGIVLNNGTTLTVREIEQALDGYVLLSVFPDDADKDKARAQRQKQQGKDQEVFWDRVAIPYESINHVWLTLTGPPEQQVVGAAPKVAQRAGAEMA